MMKNHFRLTILFTICFLLNVNAVEKRWKTDGSGGICWSVAEHDSHKDHIEMSGKYISAVIRYGVNEDRSFWLNRELVWPMLRTIPNNTHASLTRTFNFDPLSTLSINKKPIQHEVVNEVILNGTITVKSRLDDSFELIRTLYPSTNLPLYCEKYELLNNGNKPAIVEIPKVEIISQTIPSEGVDGSYTLKIQSQKHGTFNLKQRESLIFYINFSGIKHGEDFSTTDIENELTKRRDLLSEFSNNLILATPDTTLNQSFAFAKIRAAESIFQTQGGPMHGPGGLSYYAAIWANDQAEYVNPFFPYLGYDYGIESAINAYRHFARFMNPGYNPIPSSIIAEGTNIWNGAGDRGDAAMIAYGAARFALSQGDPKVATELWPLIEWCLEYNHRKLNPRGVVSSDSDELEGRFPSGKANLCTSSLYYDALISAAFLGTALGKEKKQLSNYKKEAESLRKNLISR